MSLVPPPSGSLSSPSWASPSQAVVVALLLVAVGMALLGPAPLPATGQDGVVVHSPVPAPNAVVEVGPHDVGATVSGADARLTVDGQDVGALPGDGSPATIRTEIGSGNHRLAVVVGQTEVRAWTVYAVDIDTSAVSADPVAVGLAASGAVRPGRRVVLVNPDRLEHSLAAAPLAAATDALLLPTGSAMIPTDTLAAIGVARQYGEEVMVLGGSDVIGAQVENQLQQEGYVAVRVGTGSPADVAAQAASVSPFVSVYTRGGTPVPRPVLVGPSQPPAAALAAAVQAVRRGASLLLTDGDTVGTATAAVIADRPTVWAADSLSSTAAAAVQRATPQPVVPPPPLVQRDTAIWIADAQADPALALLAARAAGQGTDVILNPATARDQVIAHTVADITTVGQAADPLDVATWWLDGPAAPMVEVTVSQDLSDDASGNEGLQVALDADRGVDEAFVYVAVAGVEWAGEVAVEGNRVVWTAGPRPNLAPGDEPAAIVAAPLVIRAVVNADAALRHVQSDAEVQITPHVTDSPDGFVVAAGTGPMVGNGTVQTYTVEVESATGLDLATVAAEAESILSDLTRGWTARGQWALQRVATSSAADIRVVVATPGTVDAYCSRAGLATGGRLSCWDGRRAMLNVDRWNSGVAPFHTDVSVYRQYLVNHEVGHGLGHSHVGCPTPGALAPVMMQQSKGLNGCMTNGWPYPNG
ncbi:hypothetical protein BH24ACT15_BH24ACT15_21880 [soil metagenome]